MEKFTLIDAIKNDNNTNDLYDRGYSKVEIILCMEECRKYEFIETNYNLTITDKGEEYYEHKQREYKLKRVLK